MRKMRGVTMLPSKLKEISVLAICHEDEHPEAYNNGALHCISPEALDQVRDISGRLQILSSV